jgi:hypothetical protein
MIYIKETFPDEDSVSIHVDGILDVETIPALQEVCNRYLNEERKIMLYVEGIIHISREGKEFLHQIQNKILLQGL